VGTVTGVLLAVDGGGSKTDVLVLAPDGTVLAHTRGGGSCPQVIGVAPALEVIDALVREALSLVNRPRVLRVGVYLSGLDLPVEIETFCAALQALPWFVQAAGVVVDNDTFALLRAGTAEHEAVAVVCGTGINCVGRRADGATGCAHRPHGRIGQELGGGPADVAIRIANLSPGLTVLIGVLAEVGHRGAVVPDLDARPAHARRPPQREPVRADVVDEQAGRSRLLG